MNNAVDIILGDRITTKLEESRRDLYILILGHYRPSKVLERLEEFRDFLHSNGYPNAKLLKDIPDDKRYSSDDDEHFVLKSKFNMQFADIILFVFFKMSEKGGPEIELDFLCNVLRDRCWRCAVFCEKSYRKRTSAMLRGNIKCARIVARSFKDNNDRQLCEAALGVLTNLSITQYWQLKSK